MNSIPILSDGIHQLKEKYSLIVYSGSEENTRWWYTTARCKKILYMVYNGSEENTLWCNIQQLEVKDTLSLEVCKI